VIEIKKTEENEMNSRNVKIVFVMLSLMAVIIACGLPASNNATQAPATNVASTATQEITAPPPTEIAVQHTIIPVNLPADRSSHAGDFDSSTTASKKTAAGGDRFTFGRFERPFNANTMDVYFSQLDIVDTLVFQDATWIYGTIVLKGGDANNALSGRYALELDLDLDGKGDWLVIASGLASTDWTVTGVQAYQDTNKDVGNKTAMFADKGAPGGDGFETLVFDQGKGNDADGAWARISPKDPNTVEIAVKRSMLGDPGKYLINMWAGNSLLDPALFDLNDHFTQEQAGAADAGLELYYPIKAVSEIDGSCRMAVGFEPTGQEPGLCEVFIPAVVGNPPPQGCRASPATINACNQDPYGHWNPTACKCDFNIPR
jgi:hypothetical protein